METIRFPGHEKFVLDLLKSIVDKSEDNFEDVGESEVNLISSDGKQFQVSPALLQNVSSYFHDLLIGSESGASIMFPDISGKVLRLFVQIIHLGKTEIVSNDVVDEVFDLCKIFGLSFTVEKSSASEEDYSPHSMILDEAQNSNDSHDQGKDFIFYVDKFLTKYL